MERTRVKAAEATRVRTSFGSSSVELPFAVPHWVGRTQLRAQRADHAAEIMGRMGQVAAATIRIGSGPVGPWAVRIVGTKGPASHAGNFRCAVLNLPAGWDSRSQWSIRIDVGSRRHGRSRQIVPERQLRTVRRCFGLTLAESRARESQ